MEDKQQLDMEGGRRTRSAYLGVSVLVLSLLLSACVATVIYMSVQQTHATNCQTPESEKVAETPNRSNDYGVRGSQPEREEPKPVKDEAHVSLRNEDGNHMKEDIEYDENRDVAFFHGPDGSFIAEDFEKGFQVVKDVEHDHCFVIPVGTNKTAGQELKTFVKNYDGQEMDVQQGKTYTAKVLPGAIEDTSFLPSEADAECSDYYWMSVVGEETEAEREQIREKRDTCMNTVWYYWYEGGDIYVIRVRIGDYFECDEATEYVRYSQYIG